MAYSEPADLLKGDIPLPARYGDGTGFINIAADEIDAQLGHLYVTPIVILDTPENRPARLLLKKINNFLASGRLITDMAAAGEDRDLHAYGASLIREALKLLEQICDGKIQLTGAERIETSATEYSGPSVYNEDPESLVEGYYQRVYHGEIRGPLNPLAPYSPRTITGGYVP